MINWNTKCVLGGAFVVGVYMAGAYNTGPEINFTRAPLMTTAWLASLFVLYYVLNTYLDLKYGCDHGTFYQTYLGW